MIEEPSSQTKTDVLDLVIGFLMEHEKQMDQMIGRLEKTIEMRPKRRQGSAYAPETKRPEEPEPSSITITITAPGDLRRLRSLRFEWKTDRKTSTNSKLDGRITVGKMRQAGGETDRDLGAA